MAAGSSEVTVVASSHGNARGMALCGPRPKEVVSVFEIHGFHVY